MNYNEYKKITWSSVFESGSSGSPSCIKLPLTTVAAFALNLPLLWLVAFASSSFAATAGSGVCSRLSLPLLWLVSFASVHLPLL